jgi:hypothetical protein
MSDRLEDRRTQVLWVHSSIDDMTNLSPNAMRVYMHLVRRANGKGVAWPSYQSVGDHCFISVSDKPATRKTFARNAIDQLIEAGLIRKEERLREDGSQTSNAYVLVNPSESSTPMPIKHPHAYEGSPHADISTPHAYKASNEGIPLEGNTNEGIPFGAPAAQTPHKAMFEAVCEAIGWDYNIISEKNRGQVGQLVKVLRTNGYEVDDIRRFMMEIWREDWRWTKNRSLPTLAQLREEIGKTRSVVKDAMPAKQLIGADGYRELLRERGITA